MKSDIENIFMVLPFGMDIKYNIYSQMYKNVFTISPELKKDLKSFLLLNQVIDTYQVNLKYDYMDPDYFLYSLYNDLVHEHHRTIIRDHDKSDDLFYNYYYEIILKEMVYINSSSYPFLTKRIKYFWRLLDPLQRMYFIKFIEIKFN